MNYAKALYKRLRDVPNLTDMFPLLYIKDNDTVIAKDGSHIAIIELEGLDYTGMSSDKYDLLFNIRKRLFEKESPFYRLDIVSRKVRISAKDKIDTQSSDPIQAMIAKAWQNNFDVTYRTKHYIVISVNKGGLLSSVGALVSNDYDINKADELKRLVEEISLELQSGGSELTSYNPKRLTGSELSSYFATQLNGRDTFINATHWDQPLSNQPVTFDAKKNYCTYGRHGDTLYSGWLSISRYSETIKHDTLERIFKLPFQFNIYQSFKAHPKNIALAMIQDEAKRLANFEGGENSLFIQEMVDLSEAVAADKITMVSHSFCIEALAESEQELNVIINKMKNALQSDGQMLMYREDRNLEALFWSRFPTMQNYNLRARNLTSQNASHLASFNRVGEGFDTCGFGARPITLFKTEEGGQYSFTFHESSEQKHDILGHTAVFGQTSSGKTTLISFLLANCLSFEDFKLICFDRLHGLKVFTDMFGGDYLNFPDDVQMNPFQIKDTKANRMFLFSWLKRLGGIDDNDSKYDSKLNDLIETNFELDKKDRGFKSLLSSLGRDGDPFYQAFQRWLPDQALGEFFNGERDSFNFDKDIVTFDATYILDEPEILARVTDYMFQQIMATVSEKVTPHVLFFDESPRYFRDPKFRNVMLEKLQEQRKKGGVVVLAAQNPQQYLDIGKDFAKSVVNALAHIIVYPNSGATKDEYCDLLGFNESELEWIKNTPITARKVMVKNRATGSSVVLDIDLTPLNQGTHKLLNCFNSSQAAVDKMTRYQKEFPDHWRTKYLRS